MLKEYTASKNKSLTLTTLSRLDNSRLILVLPALGYLKVPRNKTKIEFPTHISLLLVSKSLTKFFAILRFHLKYTAKRKRMTPITKLYTVYFNPTVVDTNAHDRCDIIQCIHVIDVYVHGRAVF